MNNFRIGNGFDVHAFTDGRKLILGGVEIPFEKGLAGHSDADVLLHAITDALLGALAMGDIGKHFPDTDPKWKGANSLLLLKNVNNILKKQNTEIVNIDATVIAESPKLAPYIKNMRHNLAKTLELDISRISIKATTVETMGALGRKEGIAAMAVTSCKKL